MATTVTAPTSTSPLSELEDVEMGCQSLRDFADEELEDSVHNTSIKRRNSSKDLLKGLLTPVKYGIKLGNAAITGGSHHKKKLQEAIAATPLDLGAGDDGNNGRKEEEDYELGPPPTMVGRNSHDGRRNRRSRSQSVNRRQNEGLRSGESRRGSSARPHRRCSRSGRRKEEIESGYDSGGTRLPRVMSSSALDSLAAAANKQTDQKEQRGRRKPSRHASRESLDARGRGRGQLAARGNSRARSSSRHRLMTQQSSQEKVAIPRRGASKYKGEVMQGSISNIGDITQGSISSFAGITQGSLESLGSFSELAGASYVGQDANLDKTNNPSGHYSTGNIGSSNSQLLQVMAAMSSSPSSRRLGSDINLNNLATTSSLGATSVPSPMKPSDTLRATPPTSQSSYSSLLGLSDGSDGDEEADEIDDSAGEHTRATAAVNIDPKLLARAREVERRLARENSLKNSSRSKHTAVNCLHSTQSTLESTPSLSPSNSFRELTVSVKAKPRISTPIRYKSKTKSKNKSYTSGEKSKSKTHVSPAPSVADGWVCTCGEQNKGNHNFCGVCGVKKFFPAEPSSWECSSCGRDDNEARFKFCVGCGTKR
jgi:hypothetical protein